MKDSGTIPIVLATANIAKEINVPQGATAVIFWDNEATTLKKMSAAGVVTNLLVVV